MSKISFAAYNVYLKFKTDDNGERFEVNDQGRNEAGTL